MMQEGGERRLNVAADEQGVEEDDPEFKWFTGVADDGRRVRDHHHHHPPYFPAAAD